MDADKETFFPLKLSVITLPQHFDCPSDIVFDENITKRTPSKNCVR